MTGDYDFRKGKRGTVLGPATGKTRITIRIDDDVLDWFRAAVHEAGGGNYQTLINDSLRQHIEREEEPLEDTVRRVLREELPDVEVRRRRTRRKASVRKSVAKEVRPSRRKSKKKSQKKQPAKRKRA